MTAPNDPATVAQVDDAVLYLLRLIKELETQVNAALQSLAERADANSNKARLHLTPAPMTRRVVRDTNGRITELIDEVRRDA